VKQIGKNMHTNNISIKSEIIREINDKIDKGLASLKARKGIDGQSVYNELLARRKIYKNL
jgi:hypothetical protein